MRRNATPWNAADGVLAACALILAGCGGGGSGGTPAPPPSVTLTAAVGSVTSGAATTLTWSSTHATSCTASGAWSGTRATAGSESTGALTSAATFTLTCTGSGGSGTASATVGITTAGPVSVQGVITYARVPYLTGNGLDYVNSRQEPARGITVEVVNAATQVVLATTTTDATGAWSVSVTGSTNLFVRSKAEMVRAAPAPLPHWRVRVGDPQAALLTYAHDGPVFGSGAGTVHDVAIPSGWDVSRVPVGTRASAPFAILDSLWRAMQLVLSVAPDTDFPALDVDWSTANPGGDTFYSGGGQPKIVLCGEANVDTDEFDPSTIIHEFGHYIEDKFSRSDSIGGPHGFDDLLDPRVAFGEGFGYAFAAMALNDPVMRDAFGNQQGQTARFSVDASNAQRRGWFNESSAQELLWDFFDPAGEANDNVALGFAPLWAVLTAEQRTTAAFTTLFSFVTKLKERAPGMQPAIDARVAAEQITAAGMDIHGTNETHVPPNTAQVSDVLPVYTPIAIGGGPVTLRTTDAFDPGANGNALSVSRFLRFAVPGMQNVRITAAAALPNHDVDIYVVRNGVIAAQGTTPTDEDFTAALPAGDYVIDVHDCGLAGCGNVATGASDITVTIAPN
ncbi:MAG TPA: hypothetical protein PLC64_10995 [Steroidobacteraceae bacterium]|nr:hypothetical protein [Steroidobacteraceae bacterium]